MILSSFFFALMAVFIRYTEHLPTFEQVLFRNLVTVSYTHLTLPTT